MALYFENNPLDYSGFATVLSVVGLFKTVSIDLKQRLAALSQPVVRVPGLSPTDGS